MDINKGANEIKESPERFFKLLEAGSLAYSDIIEYAFVIFGITKHGKTTLAHHLVGNLIKAYENDRKQIHYQLEQAKGGQAKIGNKMESQTEIPNRFQTPIQVKGHPLYVIDNPGQLDSFGINRVLSNAYFHYRVFSKVKNMKFILVFDSGTFTCNLKQTNAIFKLFFQSFTNFQQISDKILKSIAIIFTKVDRNSSLKDFKQRLQAYENTFNQSRAFNALQMQFLSKLFKQCKQNQKIKLFFKADLKVQAGKCTFLQQLHQKLQFFSREIDESQKPLSLFHNEKRVKMGNIRFSESKSVLNLTIEDFTREQMTELFKELTVRSTNMFKKFFNFIEKLVKFLLFEYDKHENVGSSLDKSERLKQTRQNKLRQFALQLSRNSICYDEQQRYKRSRQATVHKFKQQLKQSPKVQTFVQRIQLSSKLFQFCLKYFSFQTLIQRRRSTILLWIEDVERTFQVISRIYSNPQQTEMVARFLYDIKTFMDQLIIFCMIILPDEKQGYEKIKNFLSDYPLNGFLKCIDYFNELTNRTLESLTLCMMENFNMSKEETFSMDTETLMKYYFMQNPNLLNQNKQNSEALIKALSLSSLGENQKIQAVTLMFNTLNDHYKRFMHFKKIIDPKNKNTIFPQQHFQPKDIKRMILSIIVLLKQLKKVKDLLNYKTFEKHRKQTYHISTTCWNYIVKLFTLLIECQNAASKIQRQKQLQQCGSAISIDRISPLKSPRNNRSQSMNMNNRDKSSQRHISQLDDLQQIIIEILSSYPNREFIDVTFGKLINMHREEYDHVTLQNCAVEINNKYGKSLSGHQTQCMIMYDQEKRVFASKMIDILLSYASILNKYYQRDRSLAQCHEAIKYVEYCPQKLEQIQDKIQEIEIHNNLGGQWIQGLMDQRKINEFQPSLTTKRQLTKFFQTCKIEDIKLLECVQYEIFKSQG